MPKIPKLSGPMYSYLGRFTKEKFLRDGHNSFAERLMKKRLASEEKKLGLEPEDDGGPEHTGRGRHGQLRDDQPAPDTGEMRAHDEARRRRRQLIDSRDFDQLADDLLKRK